MSPRGGSCAAERYTGYELARASSNVLQTYRPSTSSAKSVGCDAEPIFIRISFLTNYRPNFSGCRFYRLPFRSVRVGWFVFRDVTNEKLKVNPEVNIQSADARLMPLLIPASSSRVGCPSFSDSATPASVDIKSSVGKSWACRQNQKQKHQSRAGVCDRGCPHGCAL